MSQSKLMNGSGEQLFHLRRIGPKATKQDAVDKMDFHKVTSIIGRNVEQVDFLIDSSNEIQRLCLSRCHARIVRQSTNQHRLFDDSLNGVFVNNIKITESCLLREGDRVTFGHRYGNKLPGGSRARQPDSEHQFLFEECNCSIAEQVTDTQEKQENDAEFKIPVARDGASPSVHQKRGRMQTQSFTPEDIQQLKQAWSEKSASSQKETRSEERDTMSPSNAREEPKTTCLELNEKAGNIQTVAEVNELDEAESKTVGVYGNNVETVVRKSVNVDESTSSENESENTDKQLLKTEDISNSGGQNGSEPQELDNSNPLEDAVENIMHELATIRNMVESPTKSTSDTSSLASDSSNNYKSPTKDACIQTGEVTDSNSRVLDTEEVKGTEPQATIDCLMHESPGNEPDETIGNKQEESDRNMLNESVQNEDTVDNEIVDSCMVSTTDKKILDQRVSNGLQLPEAKKEKNSNAKDECIAVASDALSKDNLSETDAFECEILYKENKSEIDVERVDIDQGNENRNEKVDYLLSDSIEYDFDDDTSSCVSGYDKAVLDGEMSNGDETNIDRKMASEDDTNSEREMTDEFETVSDSNANREELDENKHMSMKPEVPGVSGLCIENDIMEDHAVECISSTENKNLTAETQELTNRVEVTDESIKAQKPITSMVIEENGNNDETNSRPKRKTCDDSDSDDEKLNKKTCTDMKTPDLQKEVDINDEAESMYEEEKPLLKKKTFKKKMTNVAVMVKGFFTQRSSKKSYRLTDISSQNYICMEDGVGQYRILDLKDKEASLENDKRKVSERNGSEENDSNDEMYEEEIETAESCDAHDETENEEYESEKEFEPKDIKSTGNELLNADPPEYDADSNLLESDFGKQVHVDNEEKGIDRDNVGESSAETRTPIDSCCQEEEDCDEIEDDYEEMESSPICNEDKVICLVKETSEEEDHKGEKELADENPLYLKTTSNNDMVSEVEHGIALKTPEKLNETVVMSSQLTSPIISRVGIENFSYECQSPVIARQEVVQSSTPASLICNNQSDSEDNEDRDGTCYEERRDEESDKDDNDASSNGSELLSCNFSDEDENYFSPDIDFNYMDDTSNYTDETSTEGYAKMDDEDGEHMDNEENEIEGNDCKEITKEIESGVLKAQSESEQIETEFIDQEKMQVLYNNCSSFHENEVLTISDSETDGLFEHLIRGKTPVKRKFDFDSVDDTAKKHKSCLEDGDHTTFKTPIQKKTTMNTLNEDTDPEDITSTQLMNSTQTPDMNRFTMTQMDEIEEQLENKLQDKKEERKPTKSKARDLLAKLRAKKQQREIKIEEDVRAQSLSPGPGEEAEPGTSGQVDTKSTDVIVQQVDRHVKRCKEVLCGLRESFDAEVGLKFNPRVIAWRQELSQIEKKLEFPKTVIAVVGDTGAGKSSLMNALLDHKSVLPTSGMRACTAVVVEVVQNTTSKYFEADIEFLQRKEWFDELQVLLRDLTGLDGQIKNRQPDSTSDSYVSYCKVRAVYGKIDRYEVLSRYSTVTHWLGRTKVIKSSKPEDFRREVERYIETQDPGAGGQYWPIVKHVRLRMPKCDVCSSGAALVDLPGVRDSNAARDKIAREYLKNCTAVWVVSSIHRAIDDKTAKDLLGENFRRQLLMDGQYGSIAFICTKTDVLMPSEIIKPLKLEDKTKVHQAQISEMEDKRNDLNLTVTRCVQEKRELKETVEALKQEVKELNDNLVEIRALLDSENADSEQTEENEALTEYQEEVRNKEAEIETSERKIEELIVQKQGAVQKIHELEPELNFHQRAITVICARARNEYSKQEIRRDFKAGLKEMKRRAGMLNEDEEEEDESDDDEGDDIGSTADNLKVFCCSSTEYQKLKNLLTDDGPAQVFSTMEDTEIPTLRNYVHEMTNVRRQQALERLVRSIGRFVFDLLSYTTTGNYMHGGDRLGTKSMIESQVQQLSAAMAPVFKQLQSDIDTVFDGSIRPKMNDGASNASTEANDTCAKWGAPVNRDKTKDKMSGGMHLATYRATVRRQGVYTSRTYGAVDMNEELSEPMYRSMTIVWDKAFSGMLWRILEKLKGQILQQFGGFVQQLCIQLEQLGVPRDRSGRVGAQLQGSVANKLTEMVNYLKELITDRQRTVSRIVTPTVQEGLTQTYTVCAAECGSGMNMRIKTHMAQGIDQKRFTMFDEATNKLMQALIDLQNEIVAYVQGVCQNVLADLRAAFEPLWDTPTNCSMLRSAFLTPVTDACAGVREIYSMAGLENTEEKSLDTTGANRAVPKASCNMRPPYGAIAIKQESVNGAMDGYRPITVTVKSEIADSYSMTLPAGRLLGTGNVPLKQERLIQDVPVPGTSKSAAGIHTIGSGAYQPVIPITVHTGSSYHNSNTMSNTSSNNLVNLLPSKPHTVTSQSLLQHSIPTMPSNIAIRPSPGGTCLAAVGRSSTVQVTPAITPQYGIMRQTPGGYAVIEPVKLMNVADCGTVSVKTSSVNPKPNITIVNNPDINETRQSGNAVQAIGSGRVSVTSSVNFSSHNKENACKKSSTKNKRGTSKVKTIKTEPADTGYEKNRRPKYLGMIDLTDD